MTEELIRFLKEIKLYEKQAKTLDNRQLEMAYEMLADKLNRIIQKHSLKGS